MRISRHTLGMACAILLLTAAAAWGQGNAAGSAPPFPHKPIRIVTTDAGGSSDFMARLLAQGIAGPLGYPVVVDNRAGSGVIPGEIVSRAPADGHTLLVFTSNLWISPLLQKTSYDPVKDFAPITMATRACSILVVTPSLPVNSARDLIALAKTKPGQLNYASGSSGSASHLAGTLFKSMAGIDMMHISYKGAAQALTDVMSGQAHLMFPNAASVAPQLKSGRLKALAVTSAQPSILFPDLPTIAATGLPGYESVVLNGMFAPARTPDSVVKRLNYETVRFINLPETKERLITAGVEAVGSTPEAFTVVIKSEMARLGKVIKQAGVQAD